MKFITKLKSFILLIVILALSILSACRTKYVELKETETETLTKKTNGVVSKEIKETSIINFDELINGTVEESVLETIDETTAEETTNSDMGTTAESEINIDESETTINVFDMVVENDDRVFHGTADIDAESGYWQYGMTPCEWVYIEPNVQIISNYKPNTSQNYSIKSKVSSGLKGCYVPIFVRTDMMSNLYDGRVYIFEDYKKESPENMLFNNSLNSIKYKGQTVEEILRNSMNLTKTANGLLKNGDEYINIVYVTDLDRFIS